ncbi:MAG: hypothetical protein E6274_12105, partial [Clostridium sp.]|uniref:hypothetical protein n=1 Tax=Clostridium sp. TaxID=1506 RepID=UPI0029159A15
SEPEIIKTIIIGKLMNKENDKESIRYITEDILKKFPKIFHESVESSVKSFLKKKREAMGKILGDNRNDSQEFKNIKDSMKFYFESNKDILKEYIYDLEIINLKIESIKLSEKTIHNFTLKEFINFRYTTKGLFEKAEDVLKKLFNYDLFTNGGKNRLNDWGAYNLLKELNITTCPYCNRNYIHTYMSKSGICRADIDHFYAKSKYPFLAVSLYNFIPSCHTCNSSFKNSIDNFLIPHLYPYEDKFGQDAKFKTAFYVDEDIKENDDLNQKEIYDIRYLLGDSDNFKIEIKLNNPKSDIGTKIQNSIDTFQIQDLYNFHKDYIRELIKKSIIYNKSRIDELYTQYPELFRSREEVIKMVISNYIYDEDLGKRPLSKLTKDICEELGLR